MDSNVDLLQSSFFCAVGWAPGLERKGGQKKKNTGCPVKFHF